MRIKILNTSIHTPERARWCGSYTLSLFSLHTGASTRSFVHSFFRPTAGLWRVDDDVATACIKCMRSPVRRHASQKMMSVHDEMATRNRAATCNAHTHTQKHEWYDRTASFETCRVIYGTIRVLMYERSVCAIMASSEERSPPQKQRRMHNRAYGGHTKLNNIYEITMLNVRSPKNASALPLCDRMLCDCPTLFSATECVKKFARRNCEQHSIE